MEVGGVPRKPREFVDGAFYHVYARIARGEGVLGEEGEASRLVEIVREVKRRDGLTVFAWCVMATHYHLALRTSSVPLWRSMRLIQWRFARDHNRRQRQLGPVWQGRYQVRTVDDQRYLLQLIAYIHLNPVAAGVAKDAAAWRWSGHPDLLGKSRRPLADVDATLTLFANERSEARRAYARMLRGEREREWIGEDVASAPWWRGEDEALDDGAWEELEQPVVAHPTQGAGALDVEEYLRRACAIVGVERRVLASRTTARDAARAREAIAVVGVERFSVRVGELAKALGMHLGSASRWITRAAERRLDDDEFADRCAELERRIGRGVRGGADVRFSG